MPVIFTDQIDEASQAGNVEELKSIFEQIAIEDKTNLKDSQIYALRMACQFKQIELIKQLAFLGISPTETEDPNKPSPIDRAKKDGNTELVELLSKCVITADEATRYKETHDPEILEAKRIKNRTEIFYSWANKGILKDRKTIDRFIQDGIDISANNNAALKMSVLKRGAAAAKPLLEYPQVLEAALADNVNLVRWAGEQKRKDLIDLLLEIPEIRASVINNASFHVKWAEDNFCVYLREKLLLIPEVKYAIDKNKASPTI